MQIALDATPLTVATGGVRRYTDELARALADAQPDDTVWLTSDQPFNIPAPAPNNLRQSGGPRNALERRWWSFGLQAELSRLRADVFHGTDFAVPYLPIRPTVMTIHDVSPWKDKRWHSRANRIRKRTPTLLRLGLATMTITPSEAVRREVIDWFELSEDRVVAVPLAASAHFRPVDPTPTDQPFFLYVGTLEPRKNLPRLLDAWRQVRQRHPVDLVLAGRLRSDGPAIEPQPGLTLLGAVPDDQLPALYASAVACLYPSLYEGFGLPVLEAMQCGAAVLTSKDPALAELAGDAAICIDAQNTDAWVQAMNQAIEQPNTLQELRQRARARAAGFSWQSTAARTREVYAEAIRRFRKRAVSFA
jgi:glycosyltransferase involved in cell wall biosynthesis